MTGRGDGSGDSVGAWRLPAWLQRLPQLGWVFLALGFLDAAAAVREIFVDQPIGSNPVDWLPVLVRLLEAAGPVAIVLLPAAALTRRPEIWRESEPLFLGAVLLALGEILPVLGRMIPATNPSESSLAVGIVGSPFALIGGVALAVGIAFIGFGLPMPADRATTISTLANVAGVAGAIAIIERLAVGTFGLGQAERVSGIDIVEFGPVVIGPLTTAFVTVLAYRAISGLSDRRRHPTERRVTAVAGALWVTSTLATASLSVAAFALPSTGDLSFVVVAVSIAGLLSAGASLAMLAAYALGMAEARLTVAEAHPSTAAST